MAKKPTDDINMSTPQVELQIAPPAKASPSKLIIYGVEGIGKTTLASQFPKPLFIDLEGSTAKMKPQPAKMPDADGYIDMKRQLGQILNSKHDYKTLVIDSVDWLESWVKEFVIANGNVQSIEDFGYGKGYTLIEEEFRKLLSFLDRLIIERNMNIILVAHSIIRQATEPGNAAPFDRHELNLSKKVAPLVRQWADAMLFANYKNIVIEGKKGNAHAVGGKERVLYCNHTAVIDAKNRFNLEDVLPMSIDSLKPILAN